MSEFSTFADGEECEECNHLDKEILRRGDRLIEMAKEITTLKDRENKLIEALKWYGDTSLYMKKEYETDMNLTSAVFHKEYRENNDLSKPSLVKSYSFETTAKLKIDQGKRAREVLSELGVEL